MTLEETLKKIKETNGSNFYPLVEKMKRKAAKGLLEGYTPEKIDEIVSLLEAEDEKEVKTLVSEVDSAIDNNLEIIAEDYTTEDYDSYGLYQLSLAVKSIPLSEEEDKRSWIQKIGDTVNDAAEKKPWHLAGTAAAAGGALVGSVVGGIAHAVSKARKNKKRKQEAAKIAAKRTATVTTESVVYNSNKEYIFSEDFLNTVAPLLMVLSEDELNYLKLNSNDTVNEIIDESIEYLDEIEIPKNFTTQLILEKRNRKINRLTNVEMTDTGTGSAAKAQESPRYGVSQGLAQDSMNASLQKSRSKNSFDLKRTEAELYRKSLIDKGRPNDFADYGTVQNPTRRGVSQGLAQDSMNASLQRSRSRNSFDLKRDEARIEDKNQRFKNQVNARGGPQFTIPTNNTNTSSEATKIDRRGYTDTGTGNTNTAPTAPTTNSQNTNNSVFNVNNGNVIYKDKYNTYWDANGNQVFRSKDQLKDNGTLIYKDGTYWTGDGYQVFDTNNFDSKKFYSQPQNTTTNTPVATPQQSSNNAKAFDTNNGNVLIYKNGTYWNKDGSQVFTNPEEIKNNGTLIYKDGTYWTSDGHQVFDTKNFDPEKFYANPQATPENDMARYGEKYTQIQNQMANDQAAAQSAETLKNALSANNGNVIYKDNNGTYWDANGNQVFRSADQLKDSGTLIYNNGTYWDANGNQVFPSASAEDTATGTTDTETGNGSTGNKTNPRAPAEDTATGTTDTETGNGSTGNTGSGSGGSSSNNDWWDNIKKGVSDTWTNIKTGVGNAFNFVKNNLATPAGAIAAGSAGAVALAALINRIHKKRAARKRKEESERALAANKMYAAGVREEYLFEDEVLQIIGEDLLTMPEDEVLYLKENADDITLELIEEAEEYSAEHNLDESILGTALAATTAFNTVASTVRAIKNGFRKKKAAAQQNSDDNPQTTVTEATLSPIEIANKFADRTERDTDISKTDEKTKKMSHKKKVLDAITNNDAFVRTNFGVADYVKQSQDDKSQEYKADRDNPLQKVTGIRINVAEDYELDDDNIFELIEEALSEFSNDELTESRDDLTDMIAANLIFENELITSSDEDDSNLNEIASVSEKKFAIKHDPENYVITSSRNMIPSLGDIIKTFKNHGESSDSKLAEITQIRVTMANSDPELKKIMNEIEDECEKDPIDRKKISDLYHQFKRQYARSGIRSASKKEYKINQLDAKQPKNNLYESTLEDLLGG